MLRGLPPRVILFRPQRSEGTLRCVPCTVVVAVVVVVVLVRLKRRYRGVRCQHRQHYPCVRWNHIAWLFSCANPPCSKPQQRLFPSLPKLKLCGGLTPPPLRVFRKNVDVRLACVECDTVVVDCRHALGVPKIPSLTLDSSFCAEHIPPPSPLTAGAWQGR